MVHLHPPDNLSIDSIIDQLRKAFAAMLLIFFVSLAAIAQQRPHLSKIEFVGLKRLSTEQVIAKSGLEVGQLVDPVVLDIAAQKLVSSGLFKKVAYHLRATRDQATVTFEVEEATRRLPVSFDNFVWFSEAEIYSAIRSDIPFFDGTVPDGGDVAEKIAASLRRLLNEKKISGQVHFMPYSDESGRQELVFSVKGVNLPVCELSFPGATVFSEEELLKSARPLLRTEYSRKDVGLFAIHTLLPLYRHVGYLRAQFASSVAGLQANPTNGCKDGVVVTMSVDEGLQYSWDHAEWTDNQALGAEQLNSALGMKPGEIVDDRKLMKAQQAVTREYARKGYMTVTWNESLNFDDTRQRVSYRFAVSEGPQFRMGQLTIAGLSDEDSNRVKELWRLAPGSIFDQSYVDDFVTKSARDFLDKHPVFSGVPLKIGAETKTDRQSQTVDVTITFK